MFTVVIPTMWKPDTFEQQLILLCCSKYVDEIILINNEKEKTPYYYILNNEKILHIKPDDNLIVNPSWNIGVLLSKNNNICLLNDDLLFDINIFEFMSNHEDKSLCGLSMYNKDQEFNLTQATHRTHGFGCMMFIRKDQYEYIPNSIKLFYGDDYLFEVNKIKGRQNYFINGCENNETWGITSKDGVFSDNMTIINQINNESKEIKRIINEKSNILHAK
jgi:hypothetical protein